MHKSIGRGLAAGIFGIGLIVLPACSSPFFHSFFSSSRQESLDDKKFRSEYPKLKELLRENHFRQALAWVDSWKKVRQLSAANRRLLRKDQKTIRMIGSAYYMGIARERTHAGHYRGALSALKKAEGFTPSDPELRKMVSKARARLIVQGESGKDWADVVRKLLELKSRNPKENSINKTIGWAYAKLGRSEYTAGRYALAFLHSNKALSYDQSENEALRIKGRITGIVNGYVDKAEIAYRNHSFGRARKALEMALTIDPENSRARKDWRILAETLKLPDIRTKPGT